jgi:DNA polymerase-3 subunit gamma/tau
MRDWVRVIALEPGRLHYALAPGYPGDPGPELRDALLRATGERWQLERGEGEGTPTLREQTEAEREAGRAALLTDPLVAATLAAFPGAEIIEESAAQGGEDNWRNRA